MGKSFVRIAVDSSIINWKASQGLDPSIQSNNEKRKEYEAILKLFKLQDQGQLILVALDQVDKELSRISNESKRANRLEILSLCKEKFFSERRQVPPFFKVKLGQSFLRPLLRTQCGYPTPAP